jgi:hypothetical protein
VWRVRVSPSACRRILEGRLEEPIARGERIYGVNTGEGLWKGRSLGGVAPHIHLDLGALRQVHFLKGLEERVLVLGCNR